MENIPESVDVSRSSIAPLNRSPSTAPLTHQSTSSFATSMKRIPQSSTRSLAMAPSPQTTAAWSGRSTPTQLLEMSVTEQIAHKTRKSTVLDAKNALLILAIPDYDDYKILQPYSCRSLSNKSKFVGDKDFVTRHNPQEVNAFKQQYSRDVGTLNRQRSVLAPPHLLTTAGSSASSGFALLASQSLVSASSSSSLSSSKAATTTTHNGIWKQAFTPTSHKPCWVLTEYGIHALIGPEYRITTRIAMLPALASNSTSSVSNTPPRSPSAATSYRATTPYIPHICSPLRPETPLSSSSSFTARESARIGAGVDLLDTKQLAALARTAAFSPKSRPPSPLRSPYRTPDATTTTTNGGAFTDRSPSKAHSFGDVRLQARPATDDGSHTRTHAASVDLPSPSRTPIDAPSLSPSNEQLYRIDRYPMQSQSPGAAAALSPTTQPFAIEIAPRRIELGTLQRGDVYLFPMRVRNVGCKQERFRVQHVRALCAGYDAAIAQMSYDKDAARLAPGLAAILTLTVCFQHAGKIHGRVHVVTEGVGSCDVEITGVVC